MHFTNDLSVFFAFLAVTNPLTTIPLLLAATENSDRKERRRVAIRSAYDRANANGGTLAAPCLALLDEAGNIAPLRDLPGYASTARSHGITFVSIWQDLAQIRAIYGDRAQTVLNNHRAKLFGTGIADDATLEYISRLVGDERRTEVNLSGDLHGGRRNISEHVSYRRAAPADVLRRMRIGEAVLVYGNALPALVRLRHRGARGEQT